ncbi:hypothetical protein [Actinoplanes subtropicus]|uniref:hypothetical protein n=1 Tax=Actinoplanes subtropicus TaxID=543632 RepID=UPI0004C47785|nr:hypothetical protein [Actinoplanes subtropicus]
MSREIGERDDEGEDEDEGAGDDAEGETERDGEAEVVTGADGTTAGLPSATPGAREEDESVPQAATTKTNDKAPRRRT